METLHRIPGWLALPRKAIVVPVAFAGCASELFDIDDCNQTPAIDNHPSALKLSCGFGDPCATHAEHRRQKLMGQWHLI